MAKYGCESSGVSSPIYFAVRSLTFGPGSCVEYGGNFSPGIKTTHIPAPFHPVRKAFLPSRNFGNISSNFTPTP
jgi:hypothetical protein